MRPCSGWRPSSSRRRIGRRDWRRMREPRSAWSTSFVGFQASSCGLKRCTIRLERCRRSVRSRWPPRTCSRTPPIYSRHHETAPLNSARRLGGCMRALGDLERSTIALLPVPATGGSNGDQHAQEVVSSLDPSFRARELTFVVTQIAINTDFAAAAARRSWIERLLGRQPEGLQGPLTSAQQRAVAHLARQSLWLRNSLRGAVALGLAVLVADLSGVQHGFWVAFGTLSVLRSNALSTGQNLAPCPRRNRRRVSGRGASSCTWSGRIPPCCGYCFRSRSCSPAWRRRRSRSRPDRPRSR